MFGNRKNRIFLLLITVFILLSSFLYSNADYISLYEFCNTNGFTPVYNMTLGQITITKDNKEAVVYTTIPYIKSEGRVYYMDAPIIFDNLGEINIPKEYANVIKSLLSPQKVKTNYVIISNVNIPQEEAPPEKSDVDNTYIEAAPPEPEEKYVASEPVLDFVPINAIVIAPGHGGKDPGGIGINGLKESPIVLNISKKLYSLLTSDKNIKVVMARTKDEYITLKDRTEISQSLLAKGYNPIFVSIHANISLSKKVNGVEVYYLSDKASDADALSVEAIENAGFDKSDIEKTEALFKIISDLMRDGLRTESSFLADYISTELGKTIKPKRNVVKTANFYVLRYNSVPSVLVETGYLSHAEESKLLNNTSYQNKIADGLYKGIKGFINNYNNNKGILQ